MRHQVAVARGEVDDRLEAERLLQQPRQREATHAHARHRAVGDVDELDAQTAQILRAVEHLARVQSLRRIQLDADDEAPGLQLAPQPGALAPRRGVSARLERARDGRARRGLGRTTGSGREVVSSNSASASRIAAMCAGVVPQQPPMTRTPASAKRRAKAAK